MLARVTKPDLTYTALEGFEFTRSLLCALNTVVSKCIEKFDYLHWSIVFGFGIMAKNVIVVILFSLSLHTTQFRKNEVCCFFFEFGESF